MKNSKIKWIARTAIFIALLIVLQGATKSMGQLVTGSCVNLVLILSTILGGLYSGLTVAALSPFFAFMFGIGPALFPLVPMIALGNIVLVLVWGLLPSKVLKKPDCIVCNIITALIAAALKFVTLYLGIVKLMIPVVLKLPAEKAAVLGASFGVSQFITATIAGAIAIIALPLLKKAIKE